MIKQKIIFIILGIIILVAGIGIGYFTPHLFTANTANNTSNVTYEFINPTVTSNLNKHFIINFKPLKEEFIEIQKKYPQKTYVYFAYLNNAAWTGINERDLFTAASTIKVPLTMALYKAIEEGKITLEDLYSLQDLDLDNNFGELYKVGPDKELSIEELVQIMLEQSDNTAMNALFNVMNNLGINDPLADIYQFMGWENAPSFGVAPTYTQINLKTLSNMFITLYNAQYVSVENSNKILEYLSQTPFNDKIAAGVPEAVLVSHKIGISPSDGTFSDCGIVFAPNRHYLLCLGFNGGDETSADKFMAEVSKTAYQFVINN